MISVIFCKQTLYVKHHDAHSLLSIVAALYDTF